MIDKGFAVLLSNDESIWAKPLISNVKDITARFKDIIESQASNYFHYMLHELMKTMLI